MLFTPCQTKAACICWWHHKAARRCCCQPGTSTARTACSRLGGSCRQSGAHSKTTPPHSRAVFTSSTVIQSSSSFPSVRSAPPPSPSQASGPLDRGSRPATAMEAMQEDVHAGDQVVEDAGGPLQIEALQVGAWQCGTAARQSVAQQSTARAPPRYHAAARAIAVAALHNPHATSNSIRDQPAVGSRFSPSTHGTNTWVTTPRPPLLPASLLAPTCLSPHTHPAAGPRHPRGGHQEAEGGRHPHRRGAGARAQEGAGAAQGPERGQGGEAAERRCAWRARMAHAC